ncbi:hypothetical protein GBA52_016952, partial [Prunus armeniaca]
MHICRQMDGEPWKHPMHEEYSTLVSDKETGLSKAEFLLEFETSSKELSIMTLNLHTPISFRVVNILFGTTN